MELWKLPEKITEGSGKQNSEYIVQSVGEKEKRGILSLGGPGD